MLKDSHLSSLLERSHGVLAHDIDPEFLSSVSVALAWEYRRLFDELDRDVTIPCELKEELFAKRRGVCAVSALTTACRKHGIPHAFRKLECNGQYKLLVKIGRVVLIQEPMLELTDHPRTSDYKRELADTHGFIRQLELDLGDQPNRILDWSGTVLAVLLHAAAGSKFSAEHRELGGLMLGVPDAAYQSWVMRLDLHRIAMFGFDAIADGVASSEEVRGATKQADNVRVTLKKKMRNTGAA